MKKFLIVAGLTLLPAVALAQSNPAADRSTRLSGVNVGSIAEVCRTANNDTGHVESVLAPQLRELSANGKTLLSASDAQAICAIWRLGRNAGRVDAMAERVRVISR